MARPYSTSRVVPGPGPAATNDARHGWGYEKPLNDPAIAEIWCYTPRSSYRSGEAIDFHVHATRPVFEIEIFREGPAPEPGQQSRRAVGLQTQPRLIGFRGSKTFVRAPGRPK